MKYIEYERLNAAEKKLYESIAAGLADSAETLCLVDTDSEAVRNAYRAVYYDHPEFFWLTGGFSGKSKTVTSLGAVSKSVEITPGVNETDPDTVRRMSVKLSHFVTAAVTEAEKKDTLYEKVLCVHDRLVDRTDYDRNAPHAHDAYGCLAGRKAVCEGYAKAFQLIMQRLGITTGRICGTASSGDGSGEAHEWNCIESDGKFYQIDVTWDDPITRGASEFKSRTYEYFCITDEEMYRTHIPDRTRTFVPVCESRDYDYYIREGCFLDSYSFARFSQAAEKQLRSGSCITVEFSSAEETQKALNDLIENRNVYKINGVGNSIGYSRSATGCLLNIFVRK